MAEKPKSLLLPFVAAALFAGLGKMVFQKVQADRAARKTMVLGPVDDRIRQQLSDLVRTPR
ncbi:hypothetical protein [Pseudarthrobacter sp. PS3-L1]|uniref:hypothetical protein n=1 Tax=Pseudarthrobacter sp. PS3-L1 TaxID=3046207 RepID=UPI0024B94E95|nr:hypothetical protein [Pseudarthrobacter sp. PS3-L1]MDJ0320570.1 hypothetical protein [Pseudarthrobacter sp. PS3-L1]